MGLPPCKEQFWLSQLALKSVSWCDPSWVPLGQRVPAKLQGLYWLNGLSLPDVAACFSRGNWSRERRVLELSLWSDFVFRDEAAAEMFETQIYAADMHYVIEFHDANLTNFTARPQGAGPYLLNMEAFPTSSFQMVETQTRRAPGEHWHQPRQVLPSPARKLLGEYSLWRILDGSLKVIEPNMRSMERKLDPRGQGVRVVRYSRDCMASGACSQDTGGTCNVLKCRQWRGEATCINHAFIWKCMCPPGYCAVDGRCHAPIETPEDWPAAGPEEQPVLPGSSPFG